jgi:XTP/dITP diphosphohydrolase
MTFVLASRNRRKLAELEAILRTFSSERSKFRLLSLDDIGVTEDIAEDGTTFEENAILKASIPASKGYWGIADDSGLCVDALDGAPGVWSARFAAINGFDAGLGADGNNNALLLKKLKGLPPEKRGAKFVCVIAVCPPLGKAEAVTVRGECPGVILDEPRGTEGFGYDPLFYYEPAGKTFAELSAAEKNEVSHRARALRKLEELKIIK